MTPPVRLLVGWFVRLVGQSKCRSVIFSYEDEKLHFTLLSEHFLGTPPVDQGSNCGGLRVFCLHQHQLQSVLPDDDARFSIPAILFDIYNIQYILYWYKPAHYHLVNGLSFFAFFFPVIVIRCKIYVMIYDDIN